LGELPTISGYEGQDKKRHAWRSQFSRGRPSMRANSPSLSVTMV
jgi:hypothetical protein